MKRYINLNTYSNHSVKETVVTPKEIVEFAVKDGANAIALTDFCSIQGLQEFSKAASAYKEMGFKPIYGVQILCLNADNDSDPRKITLLARNRNGLKNIYKIISIGYKTMISYFYGSCCVYYEDIQNNREDVLVGLECTKEDLEEKQPKDLVQNEYSIADYVEIKPWREYIGAVETPNEEEIAVKLRLSEIARKLKDANKFAVATYCSNCITEQDELCYNILHEGEDACVSKFLTTEELLADFSLPKGEYAIPNMSEAHDMAKALVLDNPNAIADMIDNFSIEFDQKYKFDIANAKEILLTTTEKALHKKYGENVPELIRKRYESEIENIISHGFESYYVLAYMLAEKSRELGCLHSLRGCGGGSFVGYLLNISECNPLPPHYYCPHCKRVEFVDEEKYQSGFDLNLENFERKACPSCGEIFVGDGQNVPVEFFAGYSGDKTPDFDFNVSTDIKKDMVEYLEQIFGADKIFPALNELGFSDSIVEYSISRYCTEKDIELNDKEKDEILERIKSVHSSDNRHPAGILIVSEDKDVYDFGPIGYLDELQIVGNIDPAILLDWHRLPLEKIDIYCHDMLDQIKLMEEMTGVSAKSIKLEEIDIGAFFSGKNFTGLPFNTDFMKKLTSDIYPTTFSDLLKILGFAHGTCVWNENGENLIREGHDSCELIAHREDIMLTLQRYGIDKKTAYKIAEMVRKGKAKNLLDDEQVANLRAHNVPDWYIESMKKVCYLFPKSHSFEYVLNYLRLIWYKIYCPTAFYAAALTVKATDFDYTILAEGRKRVEIEIENLKQTLRDIPELELYMEEDRILRQKEILEIALECFDKGISFISADKNSSDPALFVPGENTIRLPLICQKQEI